MKYIITIIATFLLAFATSLLFEISFISENTIRYYLVVFLILVELLVGFMILKAIK